MADDLKKSFEQLSKKHKLPKFSELEEFQISTIEETNFLLQEIRGKIAEKIHDSTDFLTEILNPDTNITNMYESRIFSESEKKDIYELFKRLMFWRRASFQSSISNNDNSTAEFITSFFGEWKSLKTQLVEVIVKVKESWETESEQTEKLGYFG